MSSKQVLWGLVPWLLYAVLTVPGGQHADLIAAAVAAGWSVITVVRAFAAGRRPKIIDLCGLAVFATYTVIEAIGSDNTRGVLDDQGRGLAVAILAATMLISAAVHPFTEQYARSDVPDSYRSSPVFRSVHRDLSIRWGCTIAAVAISYLVEADVRAAQGSELLAFVLSWVVPVAAVAVAARQSRVSGPGRRAAAAAAGTWPEAQTRFFRSGTP